LASTPTPITSHAGTPATNRAGLTRAAAQEAARSGRKPEASAPPAVVRASSSASPPAPAGSNAKADDSRSQDPTLSAAPSTPQTGPLGAQLPAPFVAGALFESGVSRASAADIAPRATALAAGSTPSPPPIREIDVDLSPGGLEDVSMTMR